MLLPTRTGRLASGPDRRRSRLVRWCLLRDQPGPFQLQAAIAAVHADAASFAETDWAQILTLYDQLMVVAPTPVVGLNIAVALGEVRGPAAGLSAIDALPLTGYHPFHAARAEFLLRQGHRDEAADAYRRAAELAPPRPDKTSYTTRPSRLPAAIRQDAEEPLNRPDRRATRGYFVPLVPRLGSGQARVEVLGERASAAATRAGVALLWSAISPGTAGGTTWVPRSDGEGEFGERRREAQLCRDVGGEFVVAAAEVLDEGMPGGDHRAAERKRFSPRIGRSRAFSRP